MLHRRLQYHNERWILVAFTGKALVLQHVLFFIVVVVYFSIRTASRSSIEYYSCGVFEHYGIPAIASPALGTGRTSGGGDEDATA